MILRVVLIGILFSFLVPCCNAKEFVALSKPPIKRLRIFKKNHKKHSRVVAATFDITLGLFGVHRLYLGTRPVVPMIYAVTLGGGGFLVIADLGVILFTKDLEKMTDNENIFMWNVNEHP